MDTTKIKKYTIIQKYKKMINIHCHHKITSGHKIKKYLEKLKIEKNAQLKFNLICFFVVHPHNCSWLRVNRRALGILLCI